MNAINAVHRFRRGIRPNGGASSGPRRPGSYGSERGATNVGAVVVSVTVAVEAVVPLGVTEAGVAAQVENFNVAGSVQLKLTVWLNPPCGAIESVNVAVPPAATVAEF